MATLRQRAVTKERRDEDTQTQFFRASPDGRTGVSSYTGEGRHLGGIIGIPWPGSGSGFM
jgi:hypothetical protein